MIFPCPCSSSLALLSVPESLDKATLNGLQRAVGHFVLLFPWINLEANPSLDLAEEASAKWNWQLNSRIG